MFQFALVSIILFWIKIFIQICFLCNRPTKASFWSTKKRLKMNFCKTVKFTMVRLSHVDWSPIFFFVSNTMYGPFQSFAKFVGASSSKKKPNLCGKDFFSLIAEFFLENSYSNLKKSNLNKYHFRHSVFCFHTA